MSCKMEVLKVEATRKKFHDLFALFRTDGVVFNSTSFQAKHKVGGQYIIEWHDAMTELLGQSARPCEVDKPRDGGHSMT